MACGAWQNRCPIGHSRARAKLVCGDCTGCGRAPRGPVAGEPMMWLLVIAVGLLLATAGPGTHGGGTGVPTGGATGRRNRLPGHRRFRSDGSHAGIPSAWPCRTAGLPPRYGSRAGTRRAQELTVPEARPVRKPRRAIDGLLPVGGRQHGKARSRRRPALPRPRGTRSFHAGEARLGSRNRTRYADGEGRRSSRAKPSDSTEVPWMLG